MLVIWRINGIHSLLVIWGINGIQSNYFMSFTERKVKAVSLAGKNIRYHIQYELVKASILTDTVAVIAIMHFYIIATTIISIIVTRGIIIYVITQAIRYPFSMSFSLY